MCRVITFSAFVAMGSPPCWSGSFLHKQMTLMCRCELVGTSSWEQVKRQAQLEEGKQTGKGRLFFCLFSFLQLWLALKRFLRLSTS